MTANDQAIAVRPPQENIEQNLQPLKPFSPRRIRFRHPAYEDVLFVLFSTDSENGGLHHGTARIACAIVANNVWDGYLSDKQNGPRLSIGDDELLTGQDYWFHIPGQTSQSYPIVPTFRDWEFPHNNMPSAWIYEPRKAENCDSVTQMPNVVQCRDQTCRISNFHDQLESAYLCPKKQDEWFRINRMDMYNKSARLLAKDLIEDQRNRILLRKDLHGLIDNVNGPKFVIVLKAGHWVVHMLDETEEYGPLYHNRTLHDITGVAPEFLLTRFAWAIFPLLNGFLSRPEPRQLITLKNPNSEWGEYRWVSEKTIWNIKSGKNSRSRQSSPSKRRISDIAEEGEEEELNDFNADECSSTHDDNSGHRNDSRFDHLPTYPTNFDLTGPELEEAEMAEDLKHFNVLPSLFGGPDCEVTDSADRLWHEISAYPGWRRVERVKSKWLEIERSRSATSSQPVWTGDEPEMT